MARNKRLHVELTIIKLNFLQQAIDLIPSDSGGIAKKKRVNDAIAVKFKQVPSIQIASITNEGKLYVQEEKKTTVSTASITNTSSSVVNESETIVAEKPTIKYPATNFSTQYINSQYGC